MSNLEKISKNQNLLEIQKLQKNNAIFKILCKKSKINAKMLFMSIFKMNLNGFKNIFAHITETRSPNMHPTIVENSKSALPPVIYDKAPENLIAFGHLIFTYILKKFGNITSIFLKNVLQ